MFDNIYSDEQAKVDKNKKTLEETTKQADTMGAEFSQEIIEEANKEIDPDPSTAKSTLVAEFSNSSLSLSTLSMPEIDTDTEEDTDNDEEQEGPKTYEHVVNSNITCDCSAMDNGEIEDMPNVQNLDWPALNKFCNTKGYKIKVCTMCQKMDNLTFLHFASYANQGKIKFVLYCVCETLNPGYMPLKAGVCLGLSKHEILPTMYNFAKEQTTIK